MPDRLEQLSDAMASVVEDVRRSLVQVGNASGGGRAPSGTRTASS